MFLFCSHGWTVGYWFSTQPAEYRVLEPLESVSSLKVLDVVYLGWEGCGWLSRTALLQLSNKSQNDYLADNLHSAFVIIFILQWLSVLQKRKGYNLVQKHCCHPPPKKRNTVTRNSMRNITFYSETFHILKCYLPRNNVTSFMFLCDKFEFFIFNFV